VFTFHSQTLLANYRLYSDGQGCVLSACVVALLSLVSNSKATQTCTGPYQPAHLPLTPPYSNASDTPHSQLFMFVTLCRSFPLPFYFYFSFLSSGFPLNYPHAKFYSIFRSFEFPQSSTFQTLREHLSSTSKI
jgi:hypothetical protein